MFKVVIVMILNEITPSDMVCTRFVFTVHCQKLGHNYSTYNHGNMTHHYIIQPEPWTLLWYLHEMDDLAWIQFCPIVCIEITSQKPRI